MTKRRAFAYAFITYTLSAICSVAWLYYAASPHLSPLRLILVVVGYPLWLLGATAHSDLHQ